MLHSVELEKAEVPTAESLLEEVKALLPTIRSRVEESERERSIPKESAKEFLDIGLARVLLPKRYGGYEMSLQTWVDISEEIGKADASHAWCASLMMHHPHYCGQFPDAAQADLWSDGPDVSIALSFTPTSKVEPVEGGYIISCSIPYLSGINHSSRVVVGGVAPEGGMPVMKVFLVPGQEFTIKDTWHTSGMRGTGSNTVVVDRAFVPTEHTVDMTVIRDGSSQENSGRLYGVPVVYYGGMTFLGPMLGAARGALEDYRAWNAERYSLFGAPIAEYQSIQVQMARAAATLDAADLLMRRCIHDAESGDAKDLDLRARAYRDQSRANELIVDAIDMIMKISGAGGFASSNSIQRAWRDIHFAASHVSLNPELSFSAWGKRAFGVPPDPKQMVY